MKKIIPILIILLVLIGIAFFISQRQPLSRNQDGRISVVTSFYPLYFLTSEIAGDNANVTNIVPAGAEPHDFEPTSQDLVKIENSSLFIINGGEIDHWSESIVETLQAKKIPVVIAGKNVMNRELDEDGEKITDPHVWLSPRLAGKEAAAISDGLIKADPENTSYYQNRTKALQEKLAALDNEFKEGLAICERREFVTSHEAFGYLADAYGLTQVAISGVSPEAEPSVQDLAAVAKLVKEKQIPYIFFETLVSPKLSETIARETGAKTLVLDPLEGIPSGKQKEGENYFTVMRQNLQNLRLALECR